MQSIEERLAILESDFYSSKSNITNINNITNIDNKIESLKYMLGPIINSSYSGISIHNLIFIIGELRTRVEIIENNLSVIENLQKSHIEILKELHKFKMKDNIINE